MDYALLIVSAALARSLSIRTLSSEPTINDSFPELEPVLLQDLLTEFWHPDTVHHYPTLFQLTRKLHFLKAATTAGRRSEDHSPSRDLVLYRQLLTSCDNLRSFELVFEIQVWSAADLFCSAINLRYKLCIWDVTWPHLRDFKLTCKLPLEALDLLSFVRHHESTLRHLSLAQLFLLDEESDISWVDVVEEIRNLTTSLKSFRLSQLSECFPREDHRTASELTVEITNDNRHRFNRKVLKTRKLDVDI